MSSLLQQLEDAGYRQRQGWAMDTFEEGSLRAEFFRRDSETMKSWSTGGLHQDNERSGMQKLDICLPRDLTNLIAWELRLWLRRHGSATLAAAASWPIKLFALSRESAMALRSSLRLGGAVGPWACRVPEQRCIVIGLPYPDSTGVTARWRQRVPWILTHELTHALQMLRLEDHLGGASITLAEMCALLAEWLEGGDSNCDGYVEYMHDFRVGLPLGLQHRPWEHASVGYSNGPFLFYLNMRFPRLPEQLWTDKKSLACIQNMRPFEAVHLLLEREGSSLDKEWIGFCAGLLLAQAELPEEQQQTPLRRMQELYEGMAVLPSRLIDMDEWRASGSSPVESQVRACWSCQWLRFRGHGRVRVSLSANQLIRRQVWVLPANGCAPHPPSDLAQSHELILSEDSWVGLVGLGDIDSSGREASTSVNAPKVLITLI